MSIDEVDHEDHDVGNVMVLNDNQNPILAYSLRIACNSSNIYMFDINNSNLDRTLDNEGFLIVLVLKVPNEAIKVV